MAVRRIASEKLRYMNKLLNNFDQVKPTTWATITTSARRDAVIDAQEESANSAPNAYSKRKPIVTVLAGSGIGPELIKHVDSIFKSCGAPVQLQEIGISNDKELKHVLSTIRQNGVALKGNIQEKTQNANSIPYNVVLRNKLDLYAYVLECKSYPNVKSRYQNVDIAIVRQNIEGEYSMLEHQSVKGVTNSLKMITKGNTERLAKFAYEYARKNNRKKVTIVHKANIMKLTDGLFMKTCQEVGKNYGDIQTENMIVDNCCMQLVSNPYQFDVMVMPNLYGTIIANVVSGLLGGPGLFSGKNYGDNCAIFEPGTRNSASDIAGLGIANPTAMINASADLLDHVGCTDQANLIKKALYLTICEDKLHTPDLGGKATTLDIVTRVIDRMAEKNN